MRRTGGDHSRPQGTPGRIGEITARRPAGSTELVPDDVFTRYTLDRHEVVVYLREKCGGAFLHRTRYGAGKLNDRLLVEFHRLQPSGVVWIRQEHRWQLDRRLTPQPPACPQPPPPFPVP